jgi:hypothetical protein
MIARQTVAFREGLHQLHQARNNPRREALRATIRRALFAGFGVLVCWIFWLDVVGPHR